MSAGSSGEEEAVGSKGRAGGSGLGYRAGQRMRTAARVDP